MVRKPKAIYLTAVLQKVTAFSESEGHYFREALLAWHAGFERSMPWKGERDPYKIWLSEIILQQTRVEQGMPYYERLVAAYPTVEALARAPLEELLKHWQGLGYYGRARNLHAAARHIALEREGIFPRSFEEIRALKGVGDYTAAAIASFAFDLPHAVVDGNVYRVLARFWGIETPINTPEARPLFAELAQALLDPTRPGTYNQAIMDLGAQICRPRQPSCGQCPLHARCKARQNGRQEALPIKKSPSPRQHRLFLYAVFLKGDAVWMQQRPAGDIWANLYEFSLLEVPPPLTELRATEQRLLQHFVPQGPAPTLKAIHGPLRQTLSHRVVHALFYVFEFSPDETITPHSSTPAAEWVRLSEVEKKVPLPKIIAQFFREKLLYCSKDQSVHLLNCISHD